MLLTDDELTIDFDVKWKCCATKTIKRITISIAFPHKHTRTHSSDLKMKSKWLPIESKIAMF